MGNIINSYTLNFRSPLQLGILDLPNEIILHIFSFIPKEELFWTIGLTCKKFYKLSCELNGNKIEVTEKLNDYKGSLIKISRYLEVVLSITHLVIWWHPEDYIGLNESLNGNFTKFTRYKKETSIEKVPLLRYSPGVILVFKTDSGKRFVESHAALHRKILINVLKLAKQCSNLQGFYWKDTKSYGNSSLINTLYPLVNENTAASVVRTSNALNYLTLCNFHDSDIDYKKLIQKCCNLYALDLTLSYNVENNVLQCISEYCTKLKYLDLTLCSKVTDEGINHLKLMTGLEGLSLSGCTHLTAEGMENLLRRLTSLKYLNLSFCHYISDMCLTNGLHSSKDLRCLLLNNCGDITDQGIMNVVKTCKNLRAIEVEDCKKLTDVSLICISENCNRLNVLNINCVNSITNTGIVAICSGCPELNVLELNDADQITTEGFQAIVKGCSDITLLNFICCDQLEDEMLKEVVQSCRGLEFVDITSCIGITQEGIRRAFELNPYLSKLYPKGSRFYDKEYSRNRYRKIKYTVFQSINPHFKCFPLN